MEHAKHLCPSPSSQNSIKEVRLPKEKTDIQYFSNKQEKYKNPSIDQNLACYFKEMASLPVLKAEQEIESAKAIENIEKYTARGKDNFFKDELVRVWIIYHIQIIGESAANLSVELRNNTPDIPWPDITYMRNVLVHQYFGIDLNQVWDTVTYDLPDLKRKVRELLEKMQGD